MTDKRVGIITFHHSYNCGSMLQAFALQSVIEQLGYEAEIIDFSNAGQKQLYSVTQPNNSIKNILKNIILFPYKARIKKNFDSFEEFKNTEFHLSPESYSRMKQLTDSRYFSVVTGSDQVWNITIEDGDDAYYLPWVKKARKVAYAPSFGAKNVMGFQNPNHFGLLVFILILECLYLARMQFHFWLYMALIAILVFEDRIAGSRTSEVYSIALLIFTLFYAKWPNAFRKKGWQIFIQLNYIICAVLTAVSAHMMEQGSTVMKALDSAFSGRITNVVYYNQLLGPSVLGHSISFGNRTCDNLYAYLVICSGVLVFIAVTIAYLLLIRDLYKYDNIPMAIAIFFLFAYGISERLWMNIDYNMDVRFGASSISIRYKDG